MTDDIVTMLRNYADKFDDDVIPHELGMWIRYGADEIERLRQWGQELKKLLEQAQACMDIWQKSEDELIEFHHSKCLEQFVEQNAEIERLRKELELARRNKK